MAFLPPLPPTFEAALRDVRAKSPAARLAATERLANPPHAERDAAVAGLAVLADDRDPGVRSRALLALGELEAQAHLDLVLARFDDGDGRVREAALIAAGKLGGEEAGRALRRAVRSNKPEVRFQAAMSLAELGGDEALEALLPVLEDDDARVRAHAAEALAKLGDARATHALAKLLDDEDQSARTEAALALASFDDERGVPVLIDALHREDSAIAAALALYELHPESAREPLARYASKLIVAPMMRAAVGGALVRLGDPRGVKALERAMTAFRPDGRSLAAEMVGELGVLELVPELVALSKRPRGADLETVAYALEQLAGKDERARRALDELAAQGIHVPHGEEA